MWSRDWPRPKLKEIWSFKLQHFYGLENTCFIFQNLNLTWTYVVLIGILKMFYSFVIISFFLVVPVPLQLIYVVIETKQINMSKLN